MRDTRQMALLLALAGLPAVAAEVYVNGTNVDGLANHQFTRVDVRIDEKGNVHIDAPGYKVQRVTMPADAKGQAQPQAAITKKYFLLTEASYRGPGWEVEVQLNGQPLRTVSSAMDAVALDVTSKLKPGKNEVLLKAKKQLGASVNPDQVFKVLLGEGSAAAGQLTVESVLFNFQRTGAETGDVTQSYTVTTR